MKSVLKYRLFWLAMTSFALIVLMQSCASTGSPSGGKKDELPPVLDLTNSTPNKHTRFFPKKLIFIFDEFVEVKDPIKQVLVSPPLTYIPKVKNRGKKVTFEFDEKEVLRKDATYTINFGEAIVDYHEGNKLTNFSYVFSTGDVLDSLNIKGIVMDALTNKPAEGVGVCLYDNLTDSIVRKEKPFYFTKTNKSGQFSFENIKNDTFKLVALQDQNINYKYDLENESIAFWDSLVFLPDTIHKSFLLSLSLPSPKPKVITSNTKTFGTVLIHYNSPAKDQEWTISEPNITIYKEIIGDSLILNYDAVDSFLIYTIQDTIKVKPKGREDFVKKATLKNTNSNIAGQMLPKDSLVLGFNLPLMNVIFNKITISDTIGLLDDVKYSLSNDLRQIVVKYPWVAGELYKLSIDSGLVTGLYGVKNDSLGFNFNILNPEQTAGIHLVINDLDSLNHYFIYVFNAKRKLYAGNANQVKEIELTFEGLTPDEYVVEIIEDKNHNNQWDPGNYWTKTQPEKYKLIKSDKIRENWMNEVAVSWQLGLAKVDQGEDQKDAKNNKSEKSKQK